MWHEKYNLARLLPVERSRAQDNCSAFAPERPWLLWQRQLNVELTQIEAQVTPDTFSLMKSGLRRDGIVLCKYLGSTGVNTSEQAT